MGKVIHADFKRKQVKVNRYAVIFDSIRSAMDQMLSETGLHKNVTNKLAAQIAGNIVLALRDLEPHRTMKVRVVVEPAENDLRSIVQCVSDAWEEQASEHFTAMLTTAEKCICAAAIRSCVSTLHTLSLSVDELAE